MAMTNGTLELAAVLGLREGVRDGGGTAALELVEPCRDLIWSGAGIADSAGGSFKSSSVSVSVVMGLFRADGANGLRLKAFCAASDWSCRLRIASAITLTRGGVCSRSGAASLG